MKGIALDRVLGLSGLVRARTGVPGEAITTSGCARRPRFAAAWAMTFLLVALAPAAAQTSTGTIRGFVRDDSGNPLANVSVVATQEATNFQRTSITAANGFYNIPGLQPGQYVLRATSIGYADLERAVRLLIGQTLNLDVQLGVQAVALEGIEIQAARVVETTTPEIATNITAEQIQSIPLNDRNFLSLALLAPGIRNDGGSITSGAESANNINVFVDGVSFKNDILKGGVAGQDASKGNPFPQVAVQEFRIITQQFKAEYQKATSAIVTATTRSGTNDWEVSLFGFRQNEDLIEQDFFALKRCADGQTADPDFVCAEKPKVGKWQMGGSLAGPIIEDELFFFAAYEGNHQDRAFTVTATSLDQWPADIQQELRAQEGTFDSPFRSNLYFGKLTWTPNQRHRLEVSGNVRDEYDVRGFGGTDALQNAEDFNNDVNTFLAKHQYSRGNLLNEAQISYQTYHWFPVQLRTDLIGRRYAGSLKIGGRCCPQDQTQRRLELRNDVSYTLPSWAGDHVFKVGSNLDFVEYDIIKQLNVNPQFLFQPTNPTVPSQVEVGFGTPNIGADNTQFGIYAQDDWAVTPRLTLNLGVRWDYETNALNNDYVTPPEVVSEVGSRNDLLIINDDYFTSGDDRPGFKGAIQPRFGFSYDLSGDNSTVLFGGWGLYYDRNSYATLIGERERLVWKTYLIRFSPAGSVPGTIDWDPRFESRDELEDLITSGTTGKPEVFLVDNNMEPPHSSHFSAGIRQSWRDYLFSLNYTGVRSSNQFAWFFANRGQDNRTFELPSYRNVLVSTDEGKAWYDAVYFKAEKRYSEESRWGATLAYTLGWADAYYTAGDDFGGLSFRTPANFVRRRSNIDERHRVSANAIVGLPLDFRLSGIVSLGSGTRYRVFYGGDSCATGNMDCIGNEYPDGGEDGTPWGGTNPFTGDPETDSFLGIGGWAFRNVDLRLEKDFEFRGNTIGLIFEGFNVFNYDNFTGYNGRIGDLRPDGSVAPNDNFGVRTAVINDTRLQGAPRRWQFGLRYTM
ncbi:MAG: TonB-dependent receptor [Longimicrobiales bacterium]